MNNSNLVDAIQLERIKKEYRELLNRCRQKELDSRAKIYNSFTDIFYKQLGAIPLYIVDHEFLPEPNELAFQYKSDDGNFTVEFKFPLKEECFTVTISNQEATKDYNFELVFINTFCDSPIRSTSSTSETITDQLNQYDTRLKALKVHSEQKVEDFKLVQCDASLETHNDGFISFSVEPCKEFNTFIELLETTVLDFYSFN